MSQGEGEAVFDELGQFGNSAGLVTHRRGPSVCLFLSVIDKNYSEVERLF